MIQCKADMILKGATFFYGRKDAGYRVKDINFVAVKGGRIVGIGKEGEDADFTGPDTKVYEFTKDRLIMPGIHDNHVHLLQAGMLSKYADLYSARTEEEAVAMAKEYADAHPDDKWIIGIGWSKYAFKGLPNKKSIDAVISDRPVMLMDDELHSAWVNTAALEIAGITNETPDPDYGEIQRDENGEATGFLYETALSIAARIAFDFTDEQVEELVSTYMEKALRYGITSITDMTPYLGIDLSYMNAYLKMAKEDKLKIRINAALDLFADIKDVTAKRAKAEAEGNGFYRIPFLKQFVDGVPGNHTAMMLDDYSDRPGEKGGALLDLDRLNDAIEAAHLHGMSVRLHACGDAAVRAALDGYENAIIRHGRGTSRHQVEHIEVIDPADIERFAKAGIMASVQPEHVVSGMPSFADNNYPEILGPERTKYTWVFRQLLDTGAVLAGGSDCPVVEGSPFAGIYSGLERLHDDGTPEGGWNPQEKLTIEELLEIYTYGAAYGEGLENQLGTLGEGMIADIVVLDRNLLDVPSDQIKDTKVLMTIVNGDVKYSC